jgi:hypothetical protein
MKSLKRGGLWLPLSLLALLPACGQQLVELSKTDGKAAVDVDAGNNDARGADAPGTDARNVDAPNVDAPSSDSGDGNNDGRGVDAPDADLGNVDGRNTDVPAADVGGLGLDGGLPDAGGPGLDGGLPDAANPGLDGGVPEVGLGLDGGLPDAANLDAGDASAGPLAVIATSPANVAVNVPIGKMLTVTFNQPMDPTTINGTNFTLQQGLTLLLGSVSYATVGSIATFVPGNYLTPGTTYTATITTGVKNVNGVALASNYVWTFTTGACGQAPVVLRGADNFAVLAGSTVTNTGLTTVTGDLGVSPGTAVVGFGPGVVVGTQHAGDPTAAQAIADLTTAFNDAAGRTLCPVAVAGNLGGQTLTPGLYKSTSSLAVSSGDLTLDAQGDSTGIFIFQMASTLMTTSGRQVILIGGAKASHVFWQVGTSATIGSTSTFQGTIMADQAIMLSTGATLNGRALARIAAVTLDTDVVVKPAP